MVFGELKKELRDLRLMENSGTLEHDTTIEALLLHIKKFSKRLTAIEAKVAALEVEVMESGERSNADTTGER